MSLLSVLIVSCDRYSDVWPAFFSLFWKYWSDCPYPVYLGANKQSYSDERVKMVLTGEDPSWAESTRRMIEQIESRYLLLLLEDFFLRSQVKTKQVEHCLAALRSLNGGYLRLKPFPKPDRKVPGYPVLGEIIRGAPYRSSLQAAIWRKDILMQLLVDGESAWDMELIGSRRSDSLYASFYSTWKPALIYDAAVTCGKWRPWALDLCKKYGIHLDLEKRSVLSNGELSELQKRRFFYSIVNKIPWQLRRRIKNSFQKLGLLTANRQSWLDS